MKQNGFFRVGNCGECPDCQRRNIGWECVKYGNKVSGIEVLAAREKLFDKCRLPEIKEIKLWFEKKPPGADVFDLSVTQQSTMMAAWTGANGRPWKIEIKNTTTTWVSIAEFPEKAQAEAFLGCKIPD